MVSPYGQQCGNPTPGCLSERTPQRERRAHPCSRLTRRDAAARASTDRGADNEKARTTCHAILRGLEQEGRPEDEPRGRFTQRNKPDTKGQTPRSSARVRHRVVKFTEKGGGVVCAGGRGGGAGWGVVSRWAEFRFCKMRRAGGGRRRWPHTARASSTPPDWTLKNS